MKRALALLFALASCGESGPPEPSWGAVIVVQIQRPVDAPAHAAKDAARILERTLDTLGYPHARATLLDPGRMSIRVPGAEESKIREVGWIILSDGGMRLHEAADAATRSTYGQTGTVPPGFVIYDADGRKILAKASPVLRSGEVLEAWAEDRDTLFRVRKGVRNAFQAAARKGPLVLLFDERVNYMGPMRLDSPGGDGRIPAATKEEARRLAILLTAGNLPVRLGKGNSCTGKEVESVAFYGVPAKAP